MPVRAPAGDRRAGSRRPPATPTWRRSTRWWSRCPTPLTRNREPDLAAAARLRHGARRACSRRASSSCSSRPPIPAPRASGSCRCSRSPASPPGATSTSPSRPSASTRAAPTTRCATRRRSSAGLTDGVPSSAPWRSTREVCDEVVEVSTPEAAELTKLLENVFRSVNIALVNELAMLCDRMGIDVWEVVEAAATKPYGFMSLQARARGWAATACRSTRSTSPGGRASSTSRPSSSSSPARSTSAMPYFCVEKIAHALNDHSKPVRGSRVGDRRRLVQGRRRRHARVARAEDHAHPARAAARTIVYHDDFVPELPELRPALGAARRRSRAPTAR